MKKYAKKSARRFKGFFDGYADISGLLTGYSSEEIANYCAKNLLCVTKDEIYDDDEEFDDF